MDFILSDGSQEGFQKRDVISSIIFELARDQGVSWAQEAGRWLGPEGGQDVEGAWPRGGSIWG